MLAGPKHSTSVPFSEGGAVPLSVDVKEGPFVPNPVPDLAVKTSLGPQKDKDDILCTRLQSLLPFTLQMVIPLLLPVTVHLKVKVSPGQVGGGAMNCADTSTGEKYRIHSKIQASCFIHIAVQIFFKFVEDPH